MTPRFTTPALFPTISDRAAMRPRTPLRALTTGLRRLARVSPRQALIAPGAHPLSDIGMTREAVQEAAHAPWDASWLPPRGPRLPRGDTPHPAPGRRIARAGSATGRWLIAAWRRHRSRQHIARLDPALLKDIGVTYTEAEHEANLPFWR